MSSLSSAKTHLPPNEACFQVPLRFTKFDLRDYLWNVYNVEVRKVRAHVKERPLTTKGLSRRTYRPKPEKIMTVELSQPFQWPEKPTDLVPWNNELWQNRQKMMEENSEENYKQQTGNTAPMKSRERKSDDRKVLAELANKMLSGEVKWFNDVQLDPKWEKYVDDQSQASVAAAKGNPESRRKKGEEGMESE